MDKRTVESALQNFLNAWERKDVDAVVNLLADSFEYFESPLDEPLRTKEEVRELWKPVPRFKAKVSLSFVTLSLNKEFSLFRIQGNYKHMDKKTTYIDRIFLISVDNRGKITKFIQWRELKDAS